MKFKKPLFWKNINFFSLSLLPLSLFTLTYNILKLFLLAFLLGSSHGISFSENHNVLQILESLQQDIKTLERAVYADSFENKTSDNDKENLKRLQISKYFGFCEEEDSHFG